MDIKRGDVFYGDLGNARGSEQSGIRPVVVIQNDIGNKYSPIVIVAAITSVINKAPLPVHVNIEYEDFLKTKSIILLEQIRTLDKSRLREKLGSFSENTMGKINNALKISLDLNNK